MTHDEYALLDRDRRLIAEQIMAFDGLLIGDCLTSAQESDLRALACVFDMPPKPGVSPSAIWLSLRPLVAG
jgi:hypothetical protein